MAISGQKSNIEPVERVKRFAGKERRQVSNPCLTANETIVLANYIKSVEDRLEESEKILHACFNKMTGIDVHSWGELRTLLFDYQIKHDIF